MKSKAPKYVPPEGSLEEELMTKNQTNWGRVMVGWLLVIMTALLCFTSLTTCEAQANQPPMVIDNSSQVKTEHIASLEDGKVNIYRITYYNHYKGTDIRATKEVCWVTIGDLHGKTVSTHCNFNVR